MITRADMEDLRRRMVALRDRLESRGITEAEIWPLVADCERMIDEAAGGAFEDDLRLIYSLLSVVWRNVCEVEAMRGRQAG